jgi:hypothetical protein
MIGCKGVQRRREGVGGFLIFREGAEGAQARVGLVVVAVGLGGGDAAGRGGRLVMNLMQVDLDRGEARGMRGGR